jgi:hypothetical protein
VALAQRKNLCIFLMDRRSEWLAFGQAVSVYGRIWLRAIFGFLVFAKES